MTDLNVTYTPVRRDQKGLDKYGRGEDTTLVEVVVTYKGTEIRGGVFNMEQITKLVGAGTTLNNIKDMVSPKKKGLDGDRGISATNSTVTGTLSKTNIINFAKLFPEASQYTSYFKDIGVTAITVT